MTTSFGAIADDFTGATDLAALLARSGARVSLRIGVPADAPANTALLEIIALKCRTAPADETKAATAAIPPVTPRSTSCRFIQVCRSLGECSRV